MSSNGIETVVVSFTCPICERRIQRNLIHVPRELSRRTYPVSTSHRGRCSHCGEDVELIYEMRISKKGQYKLVVKDCLTYEKRHLKKRYRIETLKKS